jgi:2-hydroxy-6-oxonona-2,4-dienedioate hydrolase
VTAVLEKAPVEQAGEERFHRINGLRTFSRVLGEGPEVVLVHGAGVSSDYWLPAQRLLAAEGFRVHALDFPGFGRSEDPPWPPELPRLADHLLAWVDAAVRLPCHLVGQSLGCEIALLAAVEGEAKFPRLVLAAPAGLPELHSLAGELFRAALDAPRETLDLYRVILPAYFRCGPIRMFRSLLEQRRHMIRHLMPRVAQPALVLRGERDAVVTPERLAAVARLLPNGESATIGGAHGAHFTHAGEFVSVVAPFLRYDPAPHTLHPTP